MTAAFPQFNQYLHDNYGEKGRRLFKSWEKTEIKLTLIPIQTLFLSKCLDEKITPPFARINKRMADKRLEKDLLNCEMKIVKHAIRNNHEDQRELQKNRMKEQRELKNLLSDSDYSLMCKKVNDACYRIRINNKLRLSDKIDWLISKQRSSEEKTSVQSIRHCVNSKESFVKKAVHNLSDTVLSATQIEVLELGLKFAICTNKIPVLDYKVSAEDFGRKLMIADVYNKQHKAAGSQNAGQINTAELDAASCRFKCMPKNYFNTPVNTNKELKFSLRRWGQEVNSILKSKKPKSNISKLQMVAFKSLRDNKNIKIVPADKGNATVILNRLDYEQKMFVILDDEKHFLPYTRKNANPTKANSILIGDFLKKMKNDGLLDKVLDKRLYDFLLPSDARTPQLYGLVKVHKPEKGYPCRPIVSAVGAPNYNLGKFLVWIITPYLSKHDSYIKNASHFVDCVRKESSHKVKQVSFDVESLYTMVPVDEAISCAIHYISSDQDPKHTHEFPSEVWKRLFELCTKHCNFQFLGKHYAQIEGLSMGNPLAPPLANLFMISIEEKALSVGLFSPKIWLRYVDDIYCLLSDDEFDKLDTIVVQLNQVHPSIKFTVETEKNYSLQYF